MSGLGKVGVFGFTLGRCAQKLRVEKRPKAVIFSVNSTGPNILRAIKLIYNIVSPTLYCRFAISSS